MDSALLIGSILGAWIVTRVIYIIINYRLNKKQEAAVAFVVGLIISFLLGRYEYLLGFLIWFLLDITGVTNKTKVKKQKTEQM